MNAAERLRLEENPFAAASGGVGPPLRTALREVTREIALETPIVVLVGRAGTGKTVLMNMAARAWNNMGLTVRQVDRGDLMQITIDQRSDLLLIDEANSISDSLLRALVSAGGKPVATTMVFSCLPGSVGRFTFSAGRAAVVELAPLSRSDARHYLLEQATSAGRPDPFMPEALELVVEGSGGAPRLLQSIASLAYFSAAFDGASQIRPKHVLLYLQTKHPTKRRPQWRPLITQYPRALGGKVP
jgi:type II secretory pathway predicted ATPase ExeA